MRCNSKSVVVNFGAWIKRVVTVVVFCFLRRVAFVFQERTRGNKVQRVEQPKERVQQFS